ncbi:MAG: hypothetical protein ACRC9Y_13450 [Aeromonas veronii]
MYRIDSILHILVVVMLGVTAIFAGPETTMNLSTGIGDIALTGPAAKFAAGVGIWFLIVGFYEYVTVVGDELWRGIKYLLNK